MTMQDLKKIYADVVAANPNNEFNWGEITFSDSEGCVCVMVEVWGKLRIFFDFDQKGSFELFKEIYIDKLDELIGRIRWEFGPLP